MLFCKDMIFFFTISSNSYIFAQIYPKANANVPFIILELNLWIKIAIFAVWIQA